MSGGFNPLAAGGPDASALEMLRRLEANEWVRLGIPGFDAALTKSKWGETYDIAFSFLLTEDHRFDARSDAKRLLEWAKAHRPWRTTTLLAYVFASAHVVDIEAIVPVTESGWYHSVSAGLIDLATSTFYGFQGYSWLLEECGLKVGRD